MFVGPGDIGKKLHSVNINNSISGKSQLDSAAHDPDAIWQADEVINQPTGEEYFDPREQPDYDIKYKQTVSPEDVFLQVSNS